MAESCGSATFFKIYADRMSQEAAKLGWKIDRVKIEAAHGASMAEQDSLPGECFHSVVRPTGKTSEAVCQLSGNGVGSAPLLDARPSAAPVLNSDLDLFCVPSML